VQKVGIDPHFAYANMLCDVAWSRAFGSSLMVFADTKDQRLPGGEVSLSSILPATLANQIQQLPSGGLWEVRELSGWVLRRALLQSLGNRS
jgi:hypothetical protein